MLAIIGWSPDAPHKKRADLPAQDIQSLMDKQPMIQRSVGTSRGRRTE